MRTECPTCACRVSRHTGIDHEALARLSGDRPSDETTLTDRGTCRGVIIILKYCSLRARVKKPR
jgi:hypothetical protein